MDGRLESGVVRGGVAGLKSITHKGYFGKTLSSMGINRKTNKSFPFVKMTESHGDAHFQIWQYGVYCYRQHSHNAVRNNIHHMTILPCIMSFSAKRSCKTLSSPPCTTSQFD